MHYSFNLTRPLVIGGPIMRRGLWQATTLATLRGETKTSYHHRRLRRSAHYTPGPNAGTSNLPQTIDLLHTYRGLVAVGRIQYDEEQVRVVMQLRRLQKTLEGYAPPALSSRYFHTGTYIQEEEEEEDPWWTLDPSEREIEVDIKAIVRQKGHAEELATIMTPKGLLLTGPPGTGKSFLIDLWYGGVPTPFKIRRHYSEFVLEIYRAVWEETRKRMASVHTAEQSYDPPPKPWNRAIREQWRELVAAGSLPKKWGRQPNLGLTPTATPLSPHQTIAFAVAQRLILRHWLLVFDEVQLLDVSSATLLADVLSWFWRMGGIIVGTSNKVPDDLYKNGVQRERLEPFVEALKERCPVASLSSGKDWREVRASTGRRRTWYLCDQTQEFEQEMAQLTSNLGEIGSRTLRVFGRSLHVPWTSSGVCKFSFSELCDESLGDADYLTLASTFHTLVLTDIPILKISAKDQARRFISLIDALYESRCRIICQAESEPSDLFFPDALTPTSSGTGIYRPPDIDVMMAESVGGTHEIYRPNVSSYDAPNMAEAPSIPISPLALETLSIFSGKDEQFAFKRALSRLYEMTSESYEREESWSPLPPTSRKWENSLKAAPALPHPAPTNEESPVQAVNDELWGFEAAFEGRPSPPPKVNTDERPEAPRLREHHIWGMRRDDESQ